MSQIDVTDNYGDQILEAFNRLRKAILDKDDKALWELHDPEFKATELDGKTVTASEHITAIVEGGQLAMEFSGLSVLRISDDVAIAWGRQSLSGQLRADDVTKEISDQVADGITFVLTAVWRKSGGQWRILTYHGSLPVQ